MSVLISIVAFIVAVGVLVTVHEYGHYLVARLNGVRVLRFSIGFGRPLWCRVGRDGTEWVIAAIPLGGYVKFLDERDPDAPRGDMSRAFNRAAPGRKIAIAMAGPAANFLFAIVAYSAMFVVGIPGLKPVVGEVLPETPAAHAGIEAGDEFRTIRGTRTPTWEIAYLTLLDAVVADEPFDLTVAGPDGHERTLRVDAGPMRTLTEPGELLPGIGVTVWQPQFDAVIGEVEPGSPADRSGLRPGDRIVAVDGEPVAAWTGLVERIRGLPGRDITVTVERDRATVGVPVHVGSVVDGDRATGRLGISPRLDGDAFAGMRADTRFGPVEALARGVVRTWEMSALMLRMLGRILTGEVSAKSISGPIGIAQLAGDFAMAGSIRFLGFMAIVSISLGIINLLPIPVLDGGHLLYHLAELVKGRPVTERTEIIGQRIGLGLLAMLMGLAIYNDLARIL